MFDLELEISKIEKRSNRFVVLIKSWIYMAMNVLYFLFFKKWTDKKIKEYMSRKYSQDDVIVVAVHGIFEYYWQSLVRYMIYFDKKGKVLIPLGFDYFKPYQETVQKLSKEIQQIKEKTKAQIVLLGNSSGSVLLSRYMYQTKGKLIKEFIPLAISYQYLPSGVAFWWLLFFEKTPKNELVSYAKKLNTVKIPKTKINIYAKYDAFISKETRKVKTLRNIGFNAGHFGALYDMDVIEFVYRYIFER